MSLPGDHPEVTTQHYLMFSTPFFLQLLTGSNMDGKGEVVCHGWAPGNSTRSIKHYDNL